MAIDRRQFIGLGLGVLLTGVRPVAAAPATQRLIGCRSNAQGEHFLSLVDSSGRQLMDIRLPARGHDVAVDPTQRLAAVFARRPGEYVWIVELIEGLVLRKIEAANGRHFYGHGVFTPDGRHLLCSENDFATGDGVIGVYDAGAEFRRIGELPSHGIGPHEIRLLADGRTLVVANGGIRTHPDLPRVKANLDSMRPNLAYIDSADGSLLRRFEPAQQWHQLSIRHIDVSPDDHVAIAMQFEGRPQLQPPLIALQYGEQAMRMVSPPAAIERRLKNYCGSVAFNAAGTGFAVSSPRGGLVTLWSVTGEYVGAHEQADACGISPDAIDDAGYFISDGGGRLLQVDRQASVVGQHALATFRWDNHLQTLVPSGTGAAAYVSDRQTAPS
ncbi:MAG: DUF1513 domain-containing protein [Gammaproteobacteria bacterium]|nr:DUF1513 domain-containing protein [Gammaproteobacteria bacterium]